MTLVVKAGLEGENQSSIRPPFFDHLDASSDRATEHHGDPFEFGREDIFNCDSKQYLIRTIPEKAPARPSAPEVRYTNTLSQI